MRRSPLFTRRPARAWLFGLVIGIVAGVASIYLLAHPPESGSIVATITPGQN